MASNNSNNPTPVTTATKPSTDETKLLGNHLQLQNKNDGEKREYVFFRNGTNMSSILS